VTPRRLSAVCLFAIVVSCALIARPAIAQEGNARISGIVTDPQKAVLAGASVVAVNVETNVRFPTKTNNSGIFVLPALPVGDYRIQVEHLGFKSIVAPGIVLHTQDALEINFEMAIGSASESVTVNAETTNDSPAVSLVVNHDFIEDMPLNGRSFQDLIALAPGAVPSNGSSGQFSIDGQRADANYYSIDGVGAPTDPSGIGSELYGGTLAGTTPGQTALGTTQNLVSVDALEEFRIQTSSYDAEYGRQPGGQVEFRTRSGTNDLHGSLSEYFRNEDMDANQYFYNLYGIPRQRDRQNDFGGTLGGPVRIPKLYNGKDRTFFFFSYEGLRLATPDYVQENEPTTEIRQSAAASVQPYLNAFPIPNGPANNDGFTGQFHSGISQPSSFDAPSIRVDQTIRRKLQVFGRYASTPSSSLNYYDAGEFISQTSNSRVVTLGSTATFSPAMSDEFRFNYSSVNTASTYEPTTFGGAQLFPTALLVPGEYENEGHGTFTFRLPNSAQVPYYEFGPSTLFDQKQLNLVNTLIWVRGSHALRFGADWRRLQPTAFNSPYGSFVEFASTAGLQQGFADYQETGASQVAKPVFDNLSLFVQDHWKLTTRLSVDLGLRWEFNPVPGASNGSYPLAVTQTSNFATMQLAPMGTPMYSTNYHEFAPRVGFAYRAIPSASHSLIVRAGGGIFYDTGQNLAAAGYFGYPFQADGPLNSDVSLPLSAASLAPPSLSIPLVPPYGPIDNVADPHLTLPYTEQWSVSLDEQLSSHNTLTVSYIGNVGRKLLFYAQLQNIYSINSDFSFVGITNNSAASIYNGLQIQDQGYIAPGLQVIGSYTWAHARDSASSDTAGVEAMWGNSDNDIRHNFNLALNYKIPSPQHGNEVLRSLASGWLLANRLEALTGFPFSFIQGYTCSPLDGSAIGIASCPAFYPNLVSGQPIYLHNVPNVPGGWELNLNAFSPVPTDPTTGAPLAVGSLGRNFLRVPPFWNVNQSLQRNFPLYDRLNLSFRVDAFNILNHPNFGAPDNYMGDATQGQLIDQAVINGAAYGTGKSRILQLSLKLHF
jgi:hypothetical protein